MPFKFKLIKATRNRLQRSIQTKLAIVLLMVGFVTLSVLGSLSVWLGKQEVQNEVSKRNREVATLISGQVESYVTNLASDLEFAARSFYTVTTNSNRDNPPMIVMRLITQATNQPYQNVAWIDINGVRRSFPIELIPHADGSPPPQTPSVLNQMPLNMAEDKAFLTTKQGQTYFSPIFFAANSKVPLMIIAVPVYDTQKIYQGSLIVEASLQKLDSIIQSVKTEQSSVSFLVDESHTIISSSNPQRVKTAVTNSEILKAITGNSQIDDFINEQNELYLMGHAPVKGFSGWSVIVAQSANEALSGITRLAWVALGVVIVAVIAISFIALLLSKTITRPIRELAVAANRITTTGNLDEQIPITSQDEVGELSASFNGMVLALRKTRLALEHWNRELEHKVDLRTQQLTTTNEKLGQINDQLERANLHKSQFLANMSHELRTPLNAIIGFSEILQDQVFGEMNEKQLRYVNNILTSGRHLLGLVNDVLDLAKVEAGRMELHWERFSSGQAISETLTQLSPLATKKELQITSELSGGLDVISADRVRFRQILYNLISNAIKFTPQGGTIQIRGNLQPAKMSNNSDLLNSSEVAVFAIQDTGIGIALENLENIFDSFRQVDNSYSRQYQGTGLGLSLTRRLIEMHGGEIGVTSVPGIGSTFTFTLPLVEIPAFTDSLHPDEVSLFGK